jgi:hypothetical protein
MTKRQVFYSFHFDNDVMRVQQVRNIGSLEDNKPIASNEWEKVKQSKASIEKWIGDNMNYRSCVVVLIGEETANRPWVKYEIKKAWNDGKGLLGVYIHNLSCPRNGKSSKGRNPFTQFTLENEKLLSTVVQCYEPQPADAYNGIKNNLETWVESAITQSKIARSKIK